MTTTDTAAAWTFNARGDTFTLHSIEPPRDWRNLHYAERGLRAYYSLFNHAGAGPVFVRDEDGNQTFLTNTAGERGVYFQREDSGVVWNIAGYPVNQAGADYRCEYTPASTRLESRQGDIVCSQRVFVPRGQLFEIWTVTVANRSTRAQAISIFPYVSIDLTGFPILFRYGKNRMRWTAFHPDIHGLLTRNNSPFAPSDIYGAFLISSAAVCAATGKPAELFTPPYSFARPNLGGRWRERAIEAYDENCMCLQTRMTLAAGEEQTVQFAFGAAPDAASVAPVLELIRDGRRVEDLLDEVTRHYRELSGRMEVSTGAARIDRYINHWAPKQIESYLVFKKAYRDNLQVDCAFCSLNYGQARANLLDALSFQYEAGHAPHSFRPLVHIQYSDKPAWILMAVPQLIKESGDLSLLEVELPYIDAQGTNTSYREPVLGHLRRAMRFLYEDTGAHRINRMHYADWLDGLDGLSRVGEGESVLVSIMFAAGLREVMALAEALGNAELLQEAATMYDDVKRRVNENGWDGDWYLRGFSGNGEKVGSKGNKYGQLFLNPQSWAIIAGIADDERRGRLLASIDRYLETEIGRRLYYPAYKEYFHHIGCISAQPPDYAMNGVYNHACSFSIVAECIAGRGDKAWDVLGKIVPDGERNPSRQSQNEPFTITNSFKLAPGYYGECGEPWRTGTAGWVYRGLVEHILGVRKDYSGLLIDPCLPSHIASASVRRVFRGVTYRIELDNGRGKNRGCSSLTVNGKETAGTHLPLGPAGAEMRVRVMI